MKKELTFFRNGWMTIRKRFEDKAHLDNYLRLMARRGYKLENIKDYEGVML